MSAGVGSIVSGTCDRAAAAAGCAAATVPCPATSAARTITAVRAMPRSVDGPTGHPAAFDAVWSVEHTSAIDMLSANRGPSFVIDTVTLTPAGSAARRRSYIAWASSGSCGRSPARARRVAATISATVHFPAGRAAISAAAMSTSGCPGHATFAYPRYAKQRSTPNCVARSCVKFSATAIHFRAWRRSTSTARSRYALKSSSPPHSR
jgi:hypothetical protein